MEFKTDKPTATALYLVDRGMQGKYYRWYNADTDTWGRCGADMNEALDGKDQTAVGFFPWIGPLTGPNFKASKRVQEVSQDETPAPKAAKKRMAKAVAPAVTKAPKAAKATKTVHPDGTVWYRADRAKWIAQWNGKQEAARPTAEACLAFLKKKYNVEGKVLPKAD